MKAYLIIIISLMSLNLFSQNKNKYEIRGNIDTVSYMNYIGIEKNGKVVIDRKPEPKIFSFDEVIIFDKDNRVIQEKQYLFDGNFNSKTLYTYLNNRLSEVRRYNYDETLNWIKIYNYNDDGILQEIRWYDSDEITSLGITKMEYDLQGKLIREQEFKFDGIPANSVKYEYSGNNISKVSNYNFSGELINEITNSYDEDNILVSSVDHNINKGDFKYSYNRKGEVTHCSQILPNGTTLKQVMTFYEYDTLDNWIKKDVIEEDYLGNISIRLVERTINYRY